MIFQNNVLKEYLKNVYFITGTPCGGKTTVSRGLARKYGLLVYDVDAQFAGHQKMSDPLSQPSMNQAFRDADEFFGRSIAEYSQWLRGNRREQLDFVLLDLIRLAQNQRVLCDCHLTLKEADRLTEPSRIAFLIKEPSHLVEDYCSRSDHQGFCNFIHSASDVKKAKAVCSAALQSLNEGYYASVKNSGYFWIDRNENLTVEETLRKVGQHFGFAGKDAVEAKPLDAIEIKKVEKDTGLAAKLLDFVAGFSWEEVKEHTLGLLREWAFTDWEAVFVALAGDRIVGMATIMKTDYYPLPEIYPWISSVFVTESHRGQRLGGKLIAFINGYAREHGFERTYIPCGHAGLYERYGYRYLRDIVNYGQKTDRLYVKDL